MQLSVLHEERGLPPDVEKFALDVYNSIIENPGMPKKLKLKRHDGHIIWVIIKYESTSKKEPHDGVRGECYTPDPQKLFDKHGVGNGIDILYHNAYVYIRRVTGENHQDGSPITMTMPFIRRTKKRIYEIIVHELTHALDPKLNKKELLNARWGIGSTGETEKIETSSAAGRAGTGDKGEYYRGRPWEIDASINATAAAWVLDLKRETDWGVDEMLDFIRSKKLSLPPWLKKHRKKYIAYLYKHIMRDAEG